MFGPSLAEQVKYEFVRYTRGHGLDIGWGAKCFPHFLAVRRRDDDKRPFEPHVQVDDFSRLPDVEDNSCDFVLAAAALAGSAADMEQSLREWLRPVKPGKWLCLYEPEPDMAGLMRSINHLSKEVALDVVRCAQWPAGGYYLVLAKGEGAGLTLSYEKPKPEKSVCVVRHGGFGDQIQAASLFPELKRQGFHLTVLTDQKGRDILEHDPHVDEWFMIDRGQVPPGELVWFWKVTALHFDRFVNLNESVEGTFLAMPGRVQHSWPHEVRHARLNVNYAEHAAAIAQIPFKPEGRFYASAEETKWVADELARIKADMNKDVPMLGVDQPVFVILWTLSGSSPHKATPNQDIVISEILQRLTRAVIVTVGDVACKILEAGWEEAARIVRRSGEWSIRQTLAFAQACDLVIGPETGVLSSVAYLPLRKVVMLSHSSIENLTKHWIATDSIPGVAHCYPCHQLHYTAEFCPQDPETHMAMCQRGVRPEAIYEPIDREYTAWARIQLLRSAA
jgi:ADP-heptose:LPS heptosyltransferase